MIDDILLQYGIAGAFIIYLIQDGLAWRKMFQQFDSLIKANTEAMKQLHGTMIALMNSSQN